MYIPESGIIIHNMPPPTKYGNYRIISIEIINENNQILGGSMCAGNGKQ